MIRSTLTRWSQAVGLGLAGGVFALVSGFPALAQEAMANDLSEDLQEQPQSAEDFIIQQLGLTPDQQEDIRSIFSTYQPQIQQAIQAYDQATDQLNMVLLPASSRELITNARNQLLDRERDVYDLLFARAMAIRDVLSPTQREQINATLRNLMDLNAASTLPEVEFPLTLLGLPAMEATDQLLADGWVLVVQTPTLIQFDRGVEQLDLQINNAGRVQDVSLM